MPRTSSTRRAAPSSRISLAAPSAVRIKKDKVFFFSDYQGTRTVQGITSPVTTVLSSQERTGNFSDAAKFS